MKTPVVMISFNRADLVRLVMRNVYIANGVGDRDVFMFIDGPREGNANDLEENCKIYELMLSYQAKMPRLNVIRREKNYGCRGNIVDAVNQIITKYGQAIIIEDDILISKTFLEYMDSALEFYKGDKRIWSINAYQSPYFKVPNGYRHDIYFNPVNMCWGWGTWADRWNKVDFDLKEWGEDKDNPVLVGRLNKSGRQIVPMIDAQYSGRLNTWDIQCTYHVVKNGLMSVEPVFQLSKNIGFSAKVDGAHCKGELPIITRQKYYNFLPRLEHDLPHDERIDSQFEWIFTPKNFRTRVWRKVRRLLANFQRPNMDPEDV